MVRIVFVITVLILGSWGRDAFAQKLSTSGRPPIPKLTSPVYDETGTLSSGEADALRSKLVAFEDSTSTQIAVMIINTLNDYPQSDFAIEAAQENKIGQAKKNNGALVLLSVADRKWFIATGYGLEPTLTDAEASRIGREVLVPALRDGRYYDGLDGTVDAIMQATKGEFVAEPKSGDGEDGSAIGAFIFVIIFFVILILGRTIFGSGANRTIIGRGGSKSGCGGGVMQALLWSAILNSGKSRGSGFGGGGFGGGGGWSGGGGSFGGGGAGGSW